jgi:hypothetical protein
MNSVTVTVGVENQIVSINRRGDDTITHLLASCVRRVALLLDTTELDDVANKVEGPAGGQS